jgi:hypothetical protein
MNLKALNILNFYNREIFWSFMILVTTHYFYAVVGCALFNDINTPITARANLDDYVNFKNLFYAIMTLFKCTT